MAAMSHDRHGGGNLFRSIIIAIDKIYTAILSLQTMLLWLFLTILFDFYCLQRVNVWDGVTLDERVDFAVKCLTRSTL
jgi:hypothetical protein